MGWFHLRPSVFEGNFSGIVFELGYWFHRRFWSQRFATEGSLSLMDFAFYNLSATHVDACASTENKASIAVMKKCGLSWFETLMHPKAILVQVDRYIFDATAHHKSQHNHPKAKK